MISRVVRYNNHVFTLEPAVASVFFEEPIIRIWHVEREWVFGNVIKFLEVKQIAHY